MPSQLLQFRFTDLPLELQREIFLMSGRENMSNALRLVHVARTAYNWVSPLIYNMVTLGSDDTALFVRTLASRSPEFFATHVRCMCLSVSVEPVDAERILSICTGVKILAFWVDYLSAFPDSSLSHLISPLSLHKLSMEAQHISAVCQGAFNTPTGLNRVWYDSLTHLDIVFWPDDDLHTLPRLNQFRSLTHVGLWHPYGLVSEEVIQLILDSCQHLEILLIVVDEGDLVQKPILLQDSRIVLLPYPSAIIQDWEASFLGGQNTWLRAKEAHLASIQAQRLSGKPEVQAHIAASND